MDPALYNPKTNTIMNTNENNTANTPVENEEVKNELADNGDMHPTPKAPEAESPVEAEATREVLETPPIIEEAKPADARTAESEA